MVTWLTLNRKSLTAMPQHERKTHTHLHAHLVNCKCPVLFPACAVKGNKTNLQPCSEKAEVLPPSQLLHLNVHFLKNKRFSRLERMLMTRAQISIHFHEAECALSE